ncbi:hypothetical protein ACFCP7_16325 [Paenibacillus elgii]
MKKITYALLSIVVVLNLTSCQNPQLKKPMHSYVVTKLENNKVAIEEFNSDKQGISLEGIAYNIMHDEANRLWVPINVSNQGDPGKIVDVIESGKISKTINGIPTRPLKVLEGRGSTNVILCQDNGIESKVVFIDKKNFNIIDTIKIYGSITDGLISDNNLFISADNLKENKNSIIYKVDLNDHTNITSVSIQDSLRINSISQEGDYIYAGVLAYVRKNTTNLLKIKKATLTIDNEFEVLHSPFKIEKVNGKLLLLHFSYTSDPIFGGKLTIFDIATEKKKEIETGIIADHINVMEDKTFVLSSSVSSDYVKVNVETQSIEKLKGKQITLSNIIFAEDK